MTDTTTSDTDTLFDAYFNMWRTTAAQQRADLVAKVFAEVAPDGRLHRVTGFWGDLPEA